MNKVLLNVFGVAAALISMLMWFGILFIVLFTLQVQSIVWIMFVFYVPVSITGSVAILMAAVMKE